MMKSTDGASERLAIDPQDAVILRLDPPADRNCGGAASHQPHCGQLHRLPQNHRQYLSRRCSYRHTNRQLTRSHCHDIGRDAIQPGGGQQESDGP